MTMAITVPIRGAKRPTMRFAPGLREFITKTICRFAPEHYAVLAVRLDDPFRVVEVHVMPPLGGNASRSSVQLNDLYIGYLLNVVLLPRGLYIGGAIHTHPDECTWLSGGEEGSGQGDIPSMRAALERAQSNGMTGKAWTSFLAPIATMDPETWEPTFTGWTVRLDRPEPIATDIIFEAQATETADAAPLFPIDEWLEIGSHYQAHVNRVLADKESPKEHRQWMAAFIHQAMRDELLARKAEGHISSRSLFDAPQAIEPRP